MENRLKRFVLIGFLLFGISSFFLGCEEENIFDPQEISSINRFEKSFNKKDFEKTIPFNYVVEWENPVMQYSEQLKSNFYEFELLYVTPFNPSAVNNSKKEGFNISYKLIITENEEKELTFFIGKFFQKKDGFTKIEDLNISLNKNSGYEGVTHLYGKNNELFYAKKISRNEINNPQLFLKDTSNEETSKSNGRGNITTCTKSTVYNYIDWYRYTYDAYGNLLSVVYLYTEFVGSSSSTECKTEFFPDEPIRTPKNPDHVPCQDGSGRTDCVKAVEPRIFCENGFEADENGFCVEVTEVDDEDSNPNPVNPIIGADCRSFEFSQPPGALQKGAAVANFNHTFYAYTPSGTVEVTSNVRIAYFTAPPGMTNSRAANATALAVNVAIKATDLYFAVNSSASEFTVGDFFKKSLQTALKSFGGTITTTPPFAIRSPAPYITYLIGVGNPFDC